MGVDLQSDPSDESWMENSGGVSPRTYVQLPTTPILHASRDQHTALPHAQVESRRINIYFNCAEPAYTAHYFNIFYVQEVHSHSIFI